MGLLDRYHLHLKRPTADDDWASIRENLREMERWGNLLPIPAVQLFQLTGFPGLTTSYAKLQSFDFKTARPNTVIIVDLFVDCTVATGGGGSVTFRGAVDGTFLDGFSLATFNEAAVVGTAATGHIGIIVQPGSHTLEVWGKKGIAAGSFTFGGSARLWVQ